MPGVFMADAPRTVPPPFTPQLAGMDEQPILDGAVPLPEPQKDPVGRPAGYSQDLAERICDMIVDGATLLAICGKDGIPSRRTLFRWTKQYPEFDQMFQRALRWRCEARADEILEIAEDTSEDYRPSSDGTRMVLNKEAIARAKLRIDARFRLMAKEHPRKYGHKSTAPAPGDDDAKQVNPKTRPE